MYIAPSTNVKILKNVPLDPSYDHTLWFDSVSDQTTYFSGKTKHTLTNYTYQRSTKNKIRVEVLADNLYDCNYIMYQNENFGNKWFYAFITSVEYVNNITSEITLEIDDIQTWFFDYTMDECFVEREHSETDNMFEHYEPENIATGEYVYINKNRLLLQDLCILCMFSKDPFEVGHSAEPKQYDGVISGCVIYAYKNNSVGLNRLKIDLNSIIQAQHEDYLIAMYMCPEPDGVQWVETGGVGRGDVPSGCLGKHEVITGEASTATQPLNELRVSEGAPIGSNDWSHGYIPKNKKLYCYPYNFAMVYNGLGQELNLRYELGENGGCDVLFMSNMLTPVQSTLTPTNYKKLELGTVTALPNSCLNEQISINSYPICSWSYDAYKHYLNQNLAPVFANAIPSLLSADMALTSGLAHTKKQINRQTQGAEMTLIGATTNFLAGAHKSSLEGNIVKGNANCSNVLLPIESLTYFACRCTVTEEYAKRIDDYFTKFGYAVGRLKVPNRNSRPIWNYVKTIGCCITGTTGLPADSAEHICTIHDNGITYWKNPNAIGHYSVYDNSPRIVSLTPAP